MDIEYISRTLLKMELPGRRQRGRPMMRFRDVMREDSFVTEDAEDRVRWRRRIHCGEP